MLATQINKIGKHANLESRNKDIAKYNAMVMGVHNYYHVATGVYNSLSTISLRILRKLYTKTRTSGFAKTCSKPSLIHIKLRTNYFYVLLGYGSAVLF